MEMRRNPNNVDLPPNLYPASRGGWKYINPVDKVPTYWPASASKAEAIAAALELNTVLGQMSLAARVLGKGMTFKALFENHWAAICLYRKWKPITEKHYRGMMKNVIAELPGTLDSLELLRVSEFIDSHPANMANRYRTMLIILFRWARGKGFMHIENLAELSLRAPIEVQRERLTLDQFMAIYKCANTVTQRAMRLGLQTLQRRADLVAMRWSDIDNDTLKVRQSKTGAPLKITIGAPLQRVLSDCRDDVVSPFVIHQPSTAHANRVGGGLKPESLSRGFMRARALTGLFDDMPESARPTFHEIRALGADLYRMAGVDEKEIQALLGHSDIEMTRVYLSRHVDRWVEAVGGLDL